MSESGQPTVGQILRDARDAQGITLEDAALRLRLMQRQVDAMETDDFESLGPPVFARGFVRNYARLLGLAPEALLARMAGAPAEPVEVSHAAPRPPNSWLSSPWLIVLLLGLLVLVVVPVALYWWLNSAGEDAPGKQVPSIAQTRSGLVVAPAPATEPAEVVLPSVEVATVVPAAPATDILGARRQDEDTVPEAPAIAPVINGVLHLEFGDESWAEIKDASGRMLYRQLNPAGTSTDIPGQPPFDVVIGNAAQVRLTYNGRPIDLEPFIEGTVARFTLEE